MKQERHGWHSPSIGHHMPLQVLGHAGARVFIFPTTLGSYHEWTDRWMHREGVLGEHIERGWIQLFCLHHIHDESWYADDHVHPGHKAWMHLRYDRYLAEEVVPFSRSLNNNPFLIAAGASFGAYHALCFGLRNPHLVNRIIGLSGTYDIKRMTRGYTDPNVYAANPIDFVRGEWGGRLDAMRRQDIILAIGEHDPSIENNREMSGVLWSKGIGNALRIWNGWSHDWPYWEKMIRMYIGGHD